MLLLDDGYAPADAAGMFTISLIFLFSFACFSPPLDEIRLPPDAPPLLSRVRYADYSPL